jgi:hypothetical protein
MIETHAVNRIYTFTPTAVAKVKGLYPRWAVTQAVQVNCVLLSKVIRNPVVKISTFISALCFPYTYWL